MQCNAMQCNAMQCNAMQCNDIEYPFQSTYRETAIACIQDGVLQSLDARTHVVLVLLDLSAAFDTIDDWSRLNRRARRHTLLVRFLSYGRNTVRQYRRSLIL